MSFGQSLTLFRTEDVGTRRRLDRSAGVSRSTRIFDEVVVTVLVYHYAVTYTSAGHYARDTRDGTLISTYGRL